MKDLKQDITEMIKYCRSKDKLTISYLESCGKCKYNNLCMSIGRKSPAKMNLEYININYSQSAENQAEDEIQADLHEDLRSDKQTISELEKLVERFEMSDRKLNRIKEIVNNIDVEHGALYAISLIEELIK